MTTTLATGIIMTGTRSAIITTIITTAACRFGCPSAASW
jgi:hypothetical protein